MTDENGRVTIREVYDLLHDFRQEVKAQFDSLDAKYVLRAACKERHTTLERADATASARLDVVEGTQRADRWELAKLIGSSALVASVVTAVGVYFLTH